MAPCNNEILLALIPVEIWALVIDFVSFLGLISSGVMHLTERRSASNKLQWESWTTMHSLNLSCRDFHEIVSPVLFKSLRIRFPRERRSSQIFNQDNTHKRLHELLVPDNIVNIHQHVRLLTLSGHIGSTAYSHGASLLKLVESLPSLEIIRWRSIAFPPHLFRTLKAKQQPPLFYYESLPLPLVQDDLLGAPFIKSLNITYRSNPMSRDNIEINALGAVILSLPNLKRLVLKYNPGPQILNGANCPPKPIFDLPPATTLAPLQVLCLANFAFSPEQAATWARFLAQLQTLHHLDLDGAADMTILINHLSDCPGAVSSLRSLSFRIHDATRAENISRVTSSLDRLLCQVKHLYAFSAHDLPKEVLRKVVGHHRGNLRQRSWRHTWFPLLDEYFAGMHELNPIGVRRSSEHRSLACIFSPEEVRDLAEKLPHLQRLGVDLCFRRNTDLRSSILPTTQIPRAKLAKDPLVNESMAEDAFQYIAAEKNRHGKEALAEALAEALQSRFVQLAIKAGEWESFPWDANDRDRRYIPFAIVCWREDAIGAPDKIHMLRVESQSPWRLSFLEENKFEQAMDMAGLFGGGIEGGLDFAPGIW